MSNPFDPTAKKTAFDDDLRKPWEKPKQTPPPDTPKATAPPPCMVYGMPVTTCQDDCDGGDVSFTVTCDEVKKTAQVSDAVAVNESPGVFVNPSREVPTQDIKKSLWDIKYICRSYDELQQLSDEVATEIMGWRLDKKNNTVYWMGDSEFGQFRSCWWPSENMNNAMEAFEAFSEGRGSPKLTFWVVNGECWAGIDRHSFSAMPPDFCGRGQKPAEAVCNAMLAAVRDIGKRKENRK